MKTESLREVKNNLSRGIEELSETGAGLITKNGRTRAALIPVPVYFLGRLLFSRSAGLLAAIPASVGYNYFVNNIQILTSRMDAFALELSNIVQKQILGS